MRRHCVGWARLAIGCIVAFALTLKSFAQSNDVAALTDLPQRANQLMGLRASVIAPTAIAVHANGTAEVRTLIDGRDRTLVLEAAPIRAQGYRLVAQVADGSYIDLPSGPDEFFVGQVAGVGGSRVAATVSTQGLIARVQLPDSRTFWIEPAAAHLAGLPEFQRRADRESLHVSYFSQDVTGCSGECGVPTIAREVQAHAAAETQDAAIAGGLCVARVACDADFEFFTSYGSVEDVESRILSIINAVNLQYNAEVGVTHQVTAIIVRTAEPDPYTSSGATTLINQFKNHWNANHAGVSRDFAHLFTGKNLDGSTIGLAFQVNDSGVICNLASGYSLAQSDFSFLFACTTDLSAHEMGHNWGANHCDNNCDSTMSSSIQCANTFADSIPDSAAVIVGFRDGANCLECGDLLAISLTLTGQATTDKFGSCVAILEDTNSDGVRDYLVGAPDNDEAGVNAGKAYLYSGSNGALLWSKLGQAAGDRFGFAVAGSGNRAVVGAPYNDTSGLDAGRIYVYDAAGVQLKARNGQAPGDRFGWSLSGSGDINNDGTADYIVGAPYHDFNGAAYIYDGLNHALLKKLKGEAANDRYGWTVLIAGHFNLDGFADFVIGAPFNDNAGGANAGEAYMYSGSTFSRMASKRGAAAGDQFGRAIAALGHVNSDSLDDFAIGAPYFDAGAKTNAGRVYVYSGNSFPVLWTANGANADDQFGSAIASAGDINGDDFFDVLVGAPMNSAAGKNAGRVQVRSGINGAVVQTFNGAAAGDQLGGALAGGGGLNEPNPARVIIGASLNDTAALNAGRAFVYSGQTSGLAAAHVNARPTVRSCLADVANFDGVIDHDDLLAVLHSRARCQSQNEIAGEAIAGVDSQENACVLDVADIAAVINAWGPCTD